MSHKSKVYSASLPELSNTEIDRYFHQDNNYSGCYPKNKLPQASSLQNKFCFVNLQSSTQGNGTHWTLLYNCKPHAVIYFDSMGEVPPNEVDEIMKQTKKAQVYNSHDFQPLNSSSCGWWCVYVANMMQKGKSLGDIISHFNHSAVAHNEELLRDYFSFARHRAQL